MGGILKTVVKIAAIAVGTILGGPLGAAIAMVAVTAASSLLAPKVPKIPPSQHDRLYATIDPSAPRKIVFGLTAMATDIRYEEWSGSSQDTLHRIIAVASHKIQSVDEIWIEDRQAWTSSGGVTSTFAGYLTVSIRTEGTSANTISINGGAHWGASRRLTGCAYIYMAFKVTGNSKKAQSPFASSVPQRLTVKGRGALLYDPRLDSTVGGSGSQRANDQTTWGWSDTTGNNPALQMLFYLLGWRINGKLAVGRGIPADRIDMASFIAAANMCEETVTLAAGGTEQRYRCAGALSEADAPLSVLDTMMATCAGTMRDVGGSLSLSILHNDLATPVAAFTDDDVLGDFDWQPQRPLHESFNIIRGRRVDPSNNALYQLVDYPAISITAPDGIDRIHTFELGMVQSASQAQRLAKQELQRGQYTGTFSAQFKATAWKCQVGDVVTLTFSSLAFSTKLFRVVEQVIRMTGVCDMVLREENAAIYAWSAEETASVTAASAVIYDPLNSPLIQGIDEVDVSAAAAQAAADAAQADATSALATLTNIASDNLLTPNEKPSVIRDRDVLTAEQSGIDTQATAFSITTEKTAYDTAVSALTTYLATLTSPVLWSNLSGNTTIVGTTFHQKFKDVYDTRRTLLNKIAAEAAKRADWSLLNGVPYDEIFNSDDDVTLGFNPVFAAWSGSYPDNWANWVGGAPTKETSIVRVGSNAVRMTASGSDRGIQVDAINFTSTPLPVGTFLSGAVDFYLAARTTGLPGIKIRLYTNSAKSTFVDTNVQPGTTTGTWQRIPWTARVGAAQQIYGIRIYAMASYSALPSGSFTGDVIFGDIRFGLFDSSTDNKAVSIGSDGTLSGGGGGQVTITGLGYSGDLNATNGAPAGTQVAGVSASTVATATTNFNASNDRNNAAVTAPTIATDGTAVDHTIQADGSADISFEWSWGGNEGDIDGFLVFVYQSNSASAYTFGTTPAAETVFTIPASKRAFILFGTAPNQYYSFAVQAYRSVDKDINAAGVIKSTLVKATGSGENPYRPSASVAFAGDVTGTISGASAATVASGAGKANSGLDSSGNVLGDKVDTGAVVVGALSGSNYVTFNLATSSFSYLTVATLTITPDSDSSVFLIYLSITGYQRAAQPIGYNVRVFNGPAALDLDLLTTPEITGIYTTATTWMAEMHGLAAGVPVTLTLKFKKLAGANDAVIQDGILGALELKRSV